MKVDVNYVLWLRAEMNKINKTPFNEIEWVDKDEKIEIDPKLTEEWKFIGMTNCCFIETGFFREDPNATADDRQEVWDQKWATSSENPPLGQPLIPKWEDFPDGPPANNDVNLMEVEFKKRLYRAV